MSVSSKNLCFTGLSKTKKLMRVNKTIPKVAHTDFEGMFFCFLKKTNESPNNRNVEISRFLEASNSKNKIRADIIIQSKRVLLGALILMTIQILVNSDI